MNDDADIANDRMMEDTELAIAAARNHPPQPPPTEFCINGCGDKSMPNSRWCSAECRDDQQHRESMKRLRGL